jgi:hypothetical protein
MYTMCTKFTPVSILLRYRLFFSAELGFEPNFDTRNRFVWKKTVMKAAQKAARA